MFGVVQEYKFYWTGNIIGDEKKKTFMKTNERRAGKSP
jgi:uncharacterized protein involved in tolerance to divalent cations